MRLPCFAATAMIVALTTGCATFGEKTQPDASGLNLDAMRGKVSDATAGMRKSWSQITSTRDDNVIPVWNWASGIPTDAVRAEIVKPTISQNTIAQWLPEYHHQDIAQVASVEPEPGFKIAEIAGKPVPSLVQLTSLVEEVRAADKAVKLTLDRTSGSNQPRSVMVDPQTLVSLSHASLPEQTPIRVNEEGNPWIMVREGGIRCQLTARIERQRGLVQLVMSLANCYGPEVLLPVEVRASCDGQPLRCLNTADTLELLYGDRAAMADRADQQDAAFSEISSRNDYLMPTNFKRLNQRMVEAAKSSMSPQVPALITVPGLSYPGPAVLCDARSLSRFLLQPQLFQAGQPERTGWIMFSGDALNEARTLDVDVDLGNGPRSFRFAVPGA